MVTAISYLPLSAGQMHAHEVRRWSGSFFFRSQLASEIRRHAEAYSGRPFEDWIKSLLTAGTRCSFLDAGPFVNVNSAHDYQFLKQTQITEKLV